MVVHGFIPMTLTTNHVGPRHPHAPHHLTCSHLLPQPHRYPKQIPNSPSITKFAQRKKLEGPPVIHTSAPFLTSTGDASDQKIQELKKSGQKGLAFARRRRCLSLRRTAAAAATIGSSTAASLKTSRPPRAGPSRGTRPRPRPIPGQTGDASPASVPPDAAVLFI